MIRIDYQLRTNSMLYVGAQKPYGGNFMESWSHLPGGIVRGAVAHFLLAQCPQGEDQQRDHHRCPEREECRFYQLFGSGDSTEIIFTHGYPQDVLGERTWTLPATARSCKHQPGFRPDEQREARERPGKRPRERHGAFDILLSQLAYEELQPRMLVWKARCPCPGCGGRIDRFSGFYHRLHEEGYRQVASPRKGRLLRAAINRRRNTAEDEMLYSLEAIEAGQLLAGSLILPRQKRALVEEALCETLLTLPLGGGGSRGLGRVELKEIKEAERPDLDPLPKRLEQFNRALEEQRALYSRFDPREPLQTGKYFFTIDFQSEAILVDRFGRRCTILSPELLWGVLGLTGKLPQPERVRSYTSPIYLGGWSTAWRMPKEVMLGVSAGSLFVYGVEEVTEELLASLEQAEQQGLGERREEGLGRVVVCDPFHLEVTPV